MGVSYTIVPLSEVLALPDGSEWLEQWGFRYEISDEAGRYPTLKELLTVARSLEGYSVKSQSDDTICRVFIDEDAFSSEGCYAFFDSTEYSGQEDEPCRFYVERGCRETIILVLTRLVERCGSFLVFSDDGVGVIITEETEPDTEWYQNDA